MLDIKFQLRCFSQINFIFILYKLPKLLLLHYFPLTRIKLLKLTSNRKVSDAPHTLCTREEEFLKKIWLKFRKHHLSVNAFELPDN